MPLLTASTDQAKRAAPRIRQVVTAEETRVAARTLAKGFYDDPVFAWTLPDEERRRRNLADFLEAFARPYVRHGESYLADDATGAALWLPPGRELVPAEEEPGFIAELEATTAEDAGRLFELLEIFDQHHPEGTYRVLQLLAVEPQLQSRGIGSALMTPGLARSDREQVPTYLEATSERSIPFYERHGFEVIGEIEVPDGPTLFAMWRVPSST